MLRKEARLIEGFISLPSALETNGAITKMAESVLLDIVKEAQTMGDFASQMSGMMPVGGPQMQSAFDQGNNMVNDMTGLDFGNLAGPAASPTSAAGAIGNRNDDMADEMARQGITL